VGAGKQTFALRLAPWVPAIAWSILISWASTDLFSASHTSRYILPALHWLFPHASAETLERLHSLIRKSAHFMEYFVFGFLLLRATRGGHRGWRIRWAIVALVIAAGYSALDEFHQSFVPSRTASPWDSLLDTSGAAIAQLLLWLWFRVRTRNPTHVPEDIAPAVSDVSK
jgi:VanZ family protein